MHEQFQELFFLQTAGRKKEKRIESMWNSRTIRRSHLKIKGWMTVCESNFGFHSETINQQCHKNLWVDFPQLKSLSFLIMRRKCNNFKNCAYIYTCKVLLFCRKAVHSECCRSRQFKWRLNYNDKLLPCSLKHLITEQLERIFCDVMNP